MTKIFYWFKFLWITKCFSWMQLKVIGKGILTFDVLKYIPYIIQCNSHFLCISSHVSLMQYWDILYSFIIFEWLLQLPKLNGLETSYEIEENYKIFIILNSVSCNNKCFFFVNLYHENKKVFHNENYFQI